MNYLPFDILLHINKISEAVYISAAHSIKIKPTIQVRNGVRYVPEDEALEILSVVKGLERPSGRADAW